MVSTLGVLCLFLVCCFAVPPGKLRFTTRKAKTEGIPEARVAVLGWIRDAEFAYNTKCSSVITAGGQKNICKLKGYADVCLAVCKEGADDACGISTEVEALDKLQSKSVTVIPFDKDIIKTLPRYDQAGGTAWGYLMKFMDGGEMLKPKIWDKAFGDCSHNRILLAKAKEYKALEDQTKFDTLVTDFKNIVKYYKKFSKRIKDFQGMLDDSNGHFYTMDPAALETILWLDGEFKAVFGVGDGDDETCAIFAKLGVQEPL